MYLVLGDWSGDGHGKHDKVLLESNVEVEVVQKAYKDSCKLTGVSFNHNEDYTGKKDAPQIATEYEDSEMSVKVIDIFKNKFGLTDAMIKSWDKDIEFEPGDPVWLSDDAFVNAWIWFVKLSNPKIELNKVKEKDAIPCINGYWNKKLNVGFGYGLYY